VSGRGHERHLGWSRPAEGFVFLWCISDSQGMDPAELGRPRPSKMAFMTPATHTIQAASAAGAELDLPRDVLPRDVPLDLGDGELSALLQRSPLPVVVESHFGGWEKPWRALSDDAWRELEREFGTRVSRAAVETGKNRELAVRYGLEVIPAVLVFAGGDVVARFTGSVRVEDVAAAVRETLERARVLDVDRRELEREIAGDVEPRGAFTRTALRRRTSDDGVLARAG